MSTSYQSIYSPLVTSTANQWGIPASIFNAQIQTESGFNPNAIGAAGDSGLGQLLPSTFTSMGYSASSILDPQTNLNAAAQYLTTQYNTFGNWNDALAAYNAGPGGVNSSAGQSYASKVLAAAQNFLGLDSSSSTASDVANSVAAGELASTSGMVSPTGTIGNGQNLQTAESSVLGSAGTLLSDILAGLNWLKTHLADAAVVILAVIIILLGVKGVFSRG